MENRPGLGTVLVVRGADLMDGTPIYDIKPYIPYADCRPEAAAGFAPDPGATLEVAFPEQLLQKLPEDKREAAVGILANDPRPRYQRDPARVYALDFAGFTLRFSAAGTTLTVQSVEERL